MGGGSDQTQEKQGRPNIKSVRSLGNFLNVNLHTSVRVWVAGQNKQTKRFS